ncbi:hypothetical protein L0152_31115, partial [bacterium]|nr:hypothetical protein [bacterium]
MAPGSGGKALARSSMQVPLNAVSGDRPGGLRTLLADRLLCWVPGRESRRAGDAQARAGHDPFYRC